MKRIVISFLVSSVLATGCRRSAPPAEQAWLVMGTVAVVSVPASSSPILGEAAAVTGKEFARVEKSLSLFDPESEIARLNAAPPQQATQLGADAAAVLSAALAMAQESGGAFDPTVDPLMKLWGFRDTNSLSAPPDESAIAAVRSVTGWQQIVLEPAMPPGRAASARRLTERVHLDLGGIAKGFAVDRACDALSRHGLADFMVNLGGNLRCAGDAAEGRRGWRVGVRNPFDTRHIMGMVTLTNGEAVATSGNYERFVTISGRRYGHILDPRSGQPVEGMAGVTVIASTAMEADALSTALFVLGPEEGRGLLARHPGCAALFIPDRQPPRILVTPGLRSRFRPMPAYERSVQEIEDVPGERVERQE